MLVISISYHKEISYNFELLFYSSMPFECDIVIVTCAETREAQLLQESYLRDGRFKDHVETRALLDAKYQCVA